MDGKSRTENDSETNPIISKLKILAPLLGSLALFTSVEDCKDDAEEYFNREDDDEADEEEDMVANEPVDE